MGFAWWPRIATWWRGAGPRRPAARRPALQVEQLGERALLSGWTAGGAAEPGLVQGLLADLPAQGPGNGTAGLVVVLGGAPAGAPPKAGAGPVFAFDYRPGGGVQISPVAAPAGHGAAAVHPGGGTPERTYLVLIPSDELTTSGPVVARLERVATRAFVDPSGQALVFEMPRPPFRPDERNQSFAAWWERVPEELGNRGPKELSPADVGEGGPAAPATGDEGGELGVAGLGGPQPPQAGATAGQEWADGGAGEVEADGLAGWVISESADPALPPAPVEGPGPARVSLVPLGNNSLSAVPALLAPPAGEAGATEGASHLPADGPSLAPPPAPPDRGRPAPAGLPPAGASPVSEVGLSWVRELLLRLRIEAEGSSPPEPVLDALFILGLWGAGQERAPGPGSEPGSSAVREGWRSPRR